MIPVVYENMNTSALQYNGAWSVQSNVAHIPNDTVSAPFHSTVASGASMSLNFTGATAVTVSGSKTWGHGTYNVVSQPPTTIEVLYITFHCSSLSTEFPLIIMQAPSGL